MVFKLPEKRYFTFTDLQQRWNCTEDELFHLICSYQIVPSVFLRNESTWECRWAADGDSLIVEIPDGEYPSDLWGLHYLVYPTQTSAFDIHFDKVSELRSVGASEGNYFFRLDREIGFQEVVNSCVVLASEVTRIETGSEELKSTERPLGDRERSGYLRIIGGLLELMVDDRPARADISNQARIIEALVNAYGDKEGITESNLQKKFAAANRAVNDPTA